MLPSAIDFFKYGTIRYDPKKGQRGQQLLYNTMASGKRRKFKAQGWGGCTGVALTMFTPGCGYFIESGPKNALTHTLVLWSNSLYRKGQHTFVVTFSCKLFACICVILVHLSYCDLYTNRENIDCDSKAPEQESCPIFACIRDYLSRRSPDDSSSNNKRAITRMCTSKVVPRF